MDERFYLPDKYRNKLYRFEAGGYDGCVWHPAAVLVDGDGDVHLVNSDGGRGGLDEEEWYRKSMAAYLKAKNVATASDLNRDDPSGKSFEEYVSYKKFMLAEKRDRERIRVFNALEKELGKDEKEILGWTHLFVEYDVSTPDKVREACKAIVDWGSKYMNAGIADALHGAGYDGAGVVCTKCGKYVEDLGCHERFYELVDPDSYHGCGGVAVCHDTLLCDDCRADGTCPVCRNVALRTDGDLSELQYPERFMHRWITACDECVDRFFDDNPDFREKLVGLGELADRMKQDAGRYLGWLEANVSEACLRAAEERERSYQHKLLAEKINALRLEMREKVRNFFDDDYNVDGEVGPDDEIDY